MDEKEKQKKMPEVSIVVPVYRAKEYLRKTVEMVKAQSFADWELILVEDASGDGSLELAQGLAETDSRIRVIAQPENGGAARARNTGTRARKGRYLAFLDADDVWMPDKLEKELAFLKQKQAAFVFTSYEFGDEQAKGTGKIVHAPAALTYRQALSRTVIFTTTVMLDTEKIPEQLLYMPEIASEDTATWWQILRSGITAYGLDEVLAIYRRPKKSLSSNKGKAIVRIWNLYRRQEKLNLISSAWYFCFWALRAVLRRI